MKRLQNVFGIIKTIGDRQRGYFNYLSWLLVVGLYSETLKKALIHFTKEYWFIIAPLWILFIYFDIKIILPGERSYNDRQSSMLQDIKRKQAI